LKLANVLDEFRKAMEDAAIMGWCMESISIENIAECSKEFSEPERDSRSIPNSMVGFSRMVLRRCDESHDTIGIVKNAVDMFLRNYLEDAHRTLTVTTEVIVSPSGKEIERSTFGPHKESTLSMLAGIIRKASSSNINRIIIETRTMFCERDGR